MWAELALWKMNRDKEQWARALWREKRALDYQDWQLGLKQAREEAIKEGREEGRAKGWEEGRAEGRREGWEEGRAKGRQEALQKIQEEDDRKVRQEKLKTARKMKADGLILEKIQEYTGLSPEEIREL